MMLKDLPYHSKLASAEQYGLKIHDFINRKDTILYLGASSGTTISYISSKIPSSLIFGVDIAPLMLKDILIDVKRNKLKNVFPVLGDANKPSGYYNEVLPVIDIIYQDVAQKNQLEIFDKNVDLFLKKDGYGFLAIKSRSIDTTKNPKAIFKKVEKYLSSKYKLLKKINIHKFQKDHMFYVIQKI